MKTKIDPTTRQPYVDPATGMPIEASSRAGRQRINQIKRGRRQQKRASRRGAPQLQAGYTPTPQSVGLPSAAIPPGQASCAGSCFPNIGWLGYWLGQLGNTRRIAVSMHPENQIVIPSTMPILLAHDSPVSLLNACLVAVQGQGAKFFGQQLVPTPLADFTISLAGTTVFGTLVRLSNSYLNFKFGAYRAQLLNNGVLTTEVVIKVARIPCEFIMLNISNINGVGSVVPNAIPQVRFLNADNPAFVAASDVVYCETLNMKDIGDVPNVNQGGALNVR
jgi:hypothetical protein